jgi:hypothetical protein
MCGWPFKAVVCCIAKNVAIRDNEAMQYLTQILVRWCLSCMALLFVWCRAAPLPAIGTVADGPARVTFMGWTNTWRISNGAAELFVVPDIGARVVGYRLLGATNVVDVHPTYAGTLRAFTPPQQSVPYGGGKLWAAPQGGAGWPGSGWPPNAYWENGRGYLAPVGPRCLQLSSPPVSTSVLQFGRSIVLAPTGSAVTLHHRMRNVSAQTVTSAVWAINPMALPCQVIAPTGRYYWGTASNAFAVTNGVLYKAISTTDGKKLFIAADKPWLAGMTTNMLWVMWADAYDARTAATNEASIEIWYGQTEAHGFAELELQGPAVVLKPGQHTDYRMYWQLCRLAQPTLADALAALRAMGLLE